MKHFILLFTFISILLSANSYAQSISGPDVLYYPFPESYRINSGDISMLNPESVRFTVSNTYYASVTRCAINGPGAGFSNINGLVPNRGVVLTANYILSGYSRVSTKDVMIRNIEMSIDYFLGQDKVNIGYPIFVYTDIPRGLYLKHAAQGYEEHPILGQVPILGPVYSEPTVTWTCSNNLAIEIQYDKNVVDFMPLSIGNAWISAKIEREGIVHTVRKEFTINRLSTTKSLELVNELTSEPVLIRIYSLSGKLVYHEKNPIQFNIKNTTLSSGTYIVVSMDKENNIHKEKIIK